LVRKTDKDLTLIKCTHYHVHKAERNQHIFLVVISDRKKNKAGKELESFTFYQAIMADFLEEVMIQAQY
jgi:hypothetical protein